ncbi:hypothetical protein [Oleiagrimonas soli]|uniref:Uncharacterized protein n=1 Tax=Oleiagrimonas soli TaxID=1543381 RepID=A0A841KID7_9GAMM|nr:hypothetical protein [Oleiagrimonas soli]MBB6183529.1 hypothetical protein [Oleiagrimonas soli]
MSKGLNAKKNTMKKPALTLKEKRAVKHAKKADSQSAVVAGLAATGKRHV